MAGFRTRGCISSPLASVLLVFGRCLAAASAPIAARLLCEPIAHWMCGLQVDAKMQQARARKQTPLDQRSPAAATAVDGTPSSLPAASMPLPPPAAGPVGGAAYPGLETIPSVNASDNCTVEGGADDMLRESDDEQVLLARLREMGFADEQLNRTVLADCGNDVLKAISLLLLGVQPTAAPLTEPSDE